MKRETMISASEARKKFSKLLQGVRLGRSYVVTVRGTPVAKISPADGERWRDDGARKALLIRLRRQKTQNVGRWIRAELYENP